CGQAARLGRSPPPSRPASEHYSRQPPPAPRPAPSQVRGRDKPQILSAPSVSSLPCRSGPRAPQPRAGTLQIEPPARECNVELKQSCSTYRVLLSPQPHMLRNNRPMRGALQVASATCRGPGQW